MKFTYQTSRLSVVEIFSDTQDTDVLVAITELLSPKVVVNLPPYFQKIDSILGAQNWLKKMLSDSRLFMVKYRDSNTIIGFVFVYVGDNLNAHIGYLLGESHWGKGYATELLVGLIDFIKHENEIKLLIAGVSPDNIVSSKLLSKLGFVESVSENNKTIFYEYRLLQT